MHSPLMHPATIGPFKIERELGRGGMGEVFLARNTRLDRQVAIKTMTAHLAQNARRYTADESERFEVYLGPLGARGADVQVSTSSGGTPILA